ncbi:pitrilysin family protein [Candidatus Thiothrix sp. Deng01]|uniref:Pitrilysin family protein n=1 Tax=Candidatus Thiothrix phosphatis TaxID=3112415 RepID=A0ABU6D449_9GAMM|nr:pitrilysin family protein [Candidatus Thiothrix sp. Deng01]MEB4593088.1 pitrilysin family protein [Candidatus Thiothrix sp. Deng01]
MRRILPFAGQNRNTKTILAVAALFAGFFAPFAQAIERLDVKSPVHEYKLDNGLKILVKQDNRAPIAVVELWYKVGSSYEHDGLTGVSHVVEHMMFKGTQKHPTGEFSRIIAENGAEDNAFTSDDYTAYYQIIAADRLEVAFELESDRVRNLTLPPAEFKKELEVVKEERRWRTEDKPPALTREQFSAVAFLNSPYKNPVIGWPSDLNAMQVEDLRAWYERWYAPNNATLVVVGDVEPDKVYELAKQYYGPLKPTPDIAPPKPQVEVEQKGLRTLVVKAPAELPYLLMGYKTPALINAKEKWEPYALEVLAGIMDGGNSSRFARELVRGQEIAADASAWYSGYGRMSDLFSLSGTPSKGITVETLKAALLTQVEKLKTEQVSAAELERVKAGVIAGEIYQRDSQQGQAEQLGSLESVGLGYQLADEYVGNILAVTPEQVQAVAKKYLVEDHLTIAELEPQPIDPNKSKFEPHFER